MSSEYSDAAPVAKLGVRQVRLGSTRPPWPRLGMSLLVLAFVTAVGGHDGHAQGPPPAAPAVKPDTAPAATEGAPGRAPQRGTGRLGESVDHGFFGDLSAPPPPAVHRIQGVRLPAAEPARPAAGAGKPSAASSAAPAPPGKPAAAAPPPDAGQPPASSDPAPASPAAEPSPAQAAPVAPSMR